MRGLHRLFVLLAIVAAASLARGETFRVYHIGNSVTDTIRYKGLAELAQSRGHTHVFGRHMIPGAPLDWIHQHPHDGFQEQPFGHYIDALPKHEWDAVTLQPFDRHIEGDTGDLAMILAYIELAQQNPANRDARFYIYQRWPRRDPEKDAQGQEIKDAEGKTVHAPLDYAAKWEREYTGEWDGTNESRDYFEKLLLAVRAARPDLAQQVLMIPVGDVLYELDRRARAGQAPGLSDIADLYSDGIHFGDVGAYVVGTTFYATLYRNDPRGLPVPEAYGSIPTETAVAIQEVVWDVVSQHDHAGVKAAQ